MSTIRLFLTAVVALVATIAPQAQTIRISTSQTDLFLKVNPQGRLYQVYFGEKLVNAADAELLDWAVYAGSDGSICKRGHEAYAASGGEEFFEPALAITHADGNQTTYLHYKEHSVNRVEGGTETVITLHDKLYPVEVKLHYVAYDKENVIKTWSEICHKERGAISLWRYASTMLYLQAERYFLTNYHGDWAREAYPATQELQFGKKVIDTKLGSRAAMQSHPFFQLAFDTKASANSGKTMLGSIGWTGNFSCTFEVDNVGVLRLIPAINPYASNYQLKSGEVFTTPEFVFTLSYNGTEPAKKNLHDWARRYQLKDGMGDRLTLLNNWENTAFDFDEEKLRHLMDEAKQLGVDMFLLDDGWFGNAHPRNNDDAGLGDWQPNRTKLPNGISSLTRMATKAGVKFGLWVEPEMVNPESELYKKHPDWAITLPGRDTYYYRNQLVLDLSNPKVQDFVFSVVDDIMTENPDIAYLKWDCNSPITNIHSAYLKQKQCNLYIDHVRGVYNVMRRVSEKYPSLPMMLCAGGGGRCDYEALKYFTEFWCSDDTDPYERLYIQWSMSDFFPVKAMASHVTNWNKKASVKFRVDVASMCNLGFDIDLKSLSSDEMQFCREAVANYRRLKPVILDGDQYKLVSPYKGNHAAVNYVSKDKRHAVVFAYNLHPRYKEHSANVCLRGLDPTATYEVKEINLMPGAKTEPSRYSGDYLMKIGLPLFSDAEGTSTVYEFFVI